MATEGKKRMQRKLAVIVSAVAVAGLGVGASGASAYSISGGAYVGTATSAHSYAVAGAYTTICPAASTTFSGIATGAGTTSFTPSYGSGALVCSSFFNLAASVSQSGTWSLRVTSGPDVNGWYTGEVNLPAGTTTTIDIPAAACVQVVSGPQTFVHGVGGNVVRMRNVAPAGVELEALANGIAFTASGCPFASGSSGTYTTSGVVSIPGITIS